MSVVIQGLKEEVDKMDKFVLFLDLKVREMEHFAMASNAILNEYKLVRENILNEKGKVLSRVKFKIQLNPILQVLYHYPRSSLLLKWSLLYLSLIK